MILLGKTKGIIVLSPWKKWKCSGLLSIGRELAANSLLHASFSLQNVYDAFRGVPAYPLYKRLALALERCVSRGSFLRTSEPIKGIAEVDTKERECEWSDLIRNSELASVSWDFWKMIHMLGSFYCHLLRTWLFFRTKYTVVQISGVWDTCSRTFFLSAQR